MLARLASVCLSPRSHPRLRRHHFRRQPRSKRLVTVAVHAQLAARVSPWTITQAHLRQTRGARWGAV
jgi:hypothetical protein